MQMFLNVRKTFCKGDIFVFFFMDYSAVNSKGNLPKNVKINAIHSIQYPASRASFDPPGKIGRKKERFF